MCLHLVHRIIYSLCVGAFPKKMGVSCTKRYLQHTSNRRIITYMCYTTLIIGWHGFNCISLLGVMSMEFLSENNESTTAAEVVNLSLASMKSSGNQQEESLTSVTSLPALAQKRSMEMSKLDFATINPVADNTPIQGWECFCWNITTTGYEVKYGANFD